MILIGALYKVLRLPLLQEYGRLRQKNGHHLYNIRHTSQPPFFHYKHMHVYTREHQSVLTKGSMAMIFLSF